MIAIRLRIALMGKNFETELEGITSKILSIVGLGYVLKSHFIPYICTSYIEVCLVSLTRNYIAIYGVSCSCM